MVALTCRDRGRPAPGAAGSLARVRAKKMMACRDRKKRLRPMPGYSQARKLVLKGRQNSPHRSVDSKSKHHHAVQLKSLWAWPP